MSYTKEQIEMLEQMDKKYEEITSNIKEGSLYKCIKSVWLEERRYSLNTFLGHTGIGIKPGETILFLSKIDGKILYKKRFVITNSEFVEAYKEWQSGREYLCGRLDAVLTKMYIYVAPLYENTDWEQRVLTEDESIAMAYSKKKKQVWYVKGWPYEKLLKSIAGEETFEGCIPKRMEILDPVDERIEKIIGKTMLIDDFLDMQYKK